MKKLFIALTLALFLFSCDNGGMENENPFVGTWEHEDGSRLVFTKEIVIDYNPDGSIYWQGRYTYNDEYITINWENKADGLEI